MILLILYSEEHYGLKLFPKSTQTPISKTSSTLTSRAMSYVEPSQIFS